MRQRRADRRRKRSSSSSLLAINKRDSRHSPALRWVQHLRFKRRLEDALGRAGKRIDIVTSAIRSKNNERGSCSITGATSTRPSSRAATARATTGFLSSTTKTRAGPSSARCLGSGWISTPLLIVCTSSFACRRMASAATGLMQIRSAGFVGPLKTWTGRLVEHRLGRPAHTLHIVPESSDVCL